MPHTLSSEVANVLQQYQINPIQKPLAVGQRVTAARLPLGTPVVMANGVDAVISGQSTADCNRYRVSWFNRQIWQVQHRWIERGSLQGVYVQKQTTTEVVVAA